MSESSRSVDLIGKIFSEMEKPPEMTDEIVRNVQGPGSFFVSDRCPFKERRRKCLIDVFDSSCSSMTEETPVKEEKKKKKLPQLPERSRSVRVEKTSLGSQGLKRSRTFAADSAGSSGISTAASKRKASATAASGSIGANSRAARGSAGASTSRQGQVKYKKKTWVGEDIQVLELKNSLTKRKAIATSSSTADTDTDPENEELVSDIETNKKPPLVLDINAKPYKIEEADSEKIDVIPPPLVKRTSSRQAKKASPKRKTDKTKRLVSDSSDYSEMDSSPPFRFSADAVKAFETEQDEKKKKGKQSRSQKKKADTKSNNTSTSPAKPVKEDERATEEIARSKKTIDALRTIDESRKKLGLPPLNSSASESARKERIEREIAETNRKRAEEDAKERKEEEKREKERRRLNRRERQNEKDLKEMEEWRLTHMPEGLLPLSTPEELAAEKVRDEAFRARVKAADDFNAKLEAKKLEQERFEDENGEWMYRLQTELTKEKLSEMFEEHIDFIKDIYHEVTQTDRLIQFNLGGGARQGLMWRMRDHPFSDDQVKWTQDNIYDRWVPDITQRIFKNDFVWKVVLPEVLIKFYSVFFNVGPEEAEHRMVNTLDHKDYEERRGSPIKKLTTTTTVDKKSASPKKKPAKNKKL